MPSALDSSTFKAQLVEKKPEDLDAMADFVISHPEELQPLIANFREKKETIRYNSVRIVEIVAKKSQEMFKDSWKQFIPLLESNNGYHRASGAIMLGLLSPIITIVEINKFKQTYLSLFTDPKVMVARYAIAYSRYMVLAKPEIWDDIKQLYLQIGALEFKPFQIELLKADVYANFDAFWDINEIKEDLKLPEFTAFIKAGLTSKSPSTRKNAKSLWKKMGMNGGRT